MVQIQCTGFVIDFNLLFVWNKIGFGHISRASIKQYNIVDFCSYHVFWLFIRFYVLCTVSSEFAKLLSFQNLTKSNLEECAPLAV